MEYSCKTATGKEFEIRYMSATVVGITSVLYLEVIGHTISELVSVFSNPSETNILYGLYKGEVQKQYNGYINLIEAMVIADSQNINLALAVPSDKFGNV